VLAQQNGDGIGFFAGGASRYPDPDLVIGSPAFEQSGYDRGLEGTKSLGIAEKIGDPDQQVAEQGTDLVRVFLQPSEVILDVSRLDHLHAALDPPLKGRVLVLAEIVRGLRAQQRVDLAQRIFRMFRIESGPIADIADDPVGDFLDGQHQIDKARCNRVGRHFGKAGPGKVRALGDGQPAVLLDRLETKRPVAAAAGQHDANCALSLIFGKGGEEHIDRRPFTFPSREVPKTEPPRADGQARAGWENIDMLRFDRLTVSCVGYRHLASSADDLGQHAIAVRREVGDDHKAHAVVRRHGSEECLQRLDPTGRGTDAHDRKMRRHGSDPRIGTSPGINAERRPGYKSVCSN
jgi:hypothetical protein